MANTILFNLLKFSFGIAIFNGWVGCKEKAGS